MQRIADFLRYLWASPSTLVGLLIGGMGICTRGRMRRRGRILEFWGGFVTYVLQQMPIPGGAGAMTLGHVVLGRDPASLDRAREHELVHVRQYERWGPLFIPAYLACSTVLWCRGRNAYYENPFEREAYDHCG